MTQKGVAFIELSIRFLDEQNSVFRAVKLIILMQPDIKKTSYSKCNCMIVHSPKHNASIMVYTMKIDGKVSL